MMTEKHKKYLREIEEMNLRKEREIKEQEEGRIRNEERERLERIENERIDRQTRITAFVITILILVFVKYIEQFLFAVIAIIGLTLGVLQMLLGRSNPFK